MLANILWQLISSQIIANRTQKQQVCLKHMQFTDFKQKLFKDVASKEIAQYFQVCFKNVPWYQIPIKILDKVVCLLHPFTGKRT